MTYLVKKKLDAVLLPVRGILCKPHKIYLKIVGCLGEGSQNLFGGIIEINRPASKEVGRVVLMWKH
jgi:hypothetical protein